MKKIILLIFAISIFACKNKRYSDYKENDFIEDQGIITKVSRTSNPLDSRWNLDIEYAYNLGGEKISYGKEKGIDLMFKLGQPIVVLVHKDDYKINFYGRMGVVDNKLLEEGYIKLFNEENSKH